MPNTVVLRSSPHWPGFDLEASRAFLRGVGIAETLVIDFVGTWDAAFTVDYRTLRQRLKELSLASYEAVTDAAMVPLHAFEEETVVEDDRVVFVDDDDWLAPNLFRALPAPEGEDGLRWGSLRVGLDFDPSAPGLPFCGARPLNGIVYTNNYAVTGRGLRKTSVDAAHEHFLAEVAFRSAGFAVRDAPDYLSCTVKHPCSTVSARALMTSGFASDPFTPVRRFQEALEAARAPEGTQWVGPYLDALRAIMADVRPSAHSPALSGS